jgi:beta-phosphoglucomutase family hydrolase
MNHSQTFNLETLVEQLDLSQTAGLIFDCDGTLADTMPLHYVAWQTTMRGLGIEFGEDQFYALAGTPTVQIVQRLLDGNGVIGDARIIAKQKEKSFLEMLDQVQPIEPVVEIARRYQGSLRMGVGSGSSRMVVLQILNQIGLTNLFPVVIAAEDTTRHKPEPDVFLEVAKRIEVAPKLCCVFEDADLGIEAAKRGGMQCVDIRAFHTPRRMTQ